MKSFADVLANSDIAAEYANQVESKNKSGFDNEDARFWDARHLVDKSTGTGYATFRFLPAHPDEKTSFVKYVEHSFQGANGKWYINKSRKNLGHDEKDPVAIYNEPIWADKSLSKEERNKRLLPRRLNYVANIYMIDDPVRPENNGKVFLFRFGKSIMDKIDECFKPLRPTTPKTNPFMPTELGGNFELDIYTKNFNGRDVPQYDKSKFTEGKALFADMSEFDKVWHSQHELQPLVNEAAHKSFEELQREFDRAMGNDEPEFMRDSDNGSSRPSEESEERQQTWTGSASKPSANPDLVEAGSMSSILDDELPDFSGGEKTEAEDKPAFDLDWMKDITG